MQRAHALEGCPLDAARISALLQRELGVFQAVERWRQAGIWIRSWKDPGYPEQFKPLKHRAPVLLFGYGEPNAFTGRSLAIVGSRDASAERLDFAAQIGRSCAKGKITVVSGGAAGVDSAAMKAGMDSGGTVVGVLADSLLKRSGETTYRTGIMERRLCLMSEAHPEARFDVGNAMARNRMAYACAQAALVVECEAGRGGTWNGANEAIRENKPVFVLRGARAERELCELGARVLDLDQALYPQRLIEPGAAPQVSRVALAAGEMLERLVARHGPDEDTLAAHLRSESTLLARAILSLFGERAPSTSAATVPGKLDTPRQVTIVVGHTADQSPSPNELGGLFEHQRSESPHTW
jgi:hypothetical protein